MIVRTPVALAHPILAEFIEANNHTDLKIAYISLATWASAATRISSLFSKGSFQHFTFQGCMHILLALESLKFKEYDFVVVTEFHLSHMLFAAPIFCLKHRKLIFMIHGCQQLATKSLLRYLALLYFKMFNFKAIQFELPDVGLLPKYRLKKGQAYVLPLPIASSLKPRMLHGERLSVDSKIKIAIIGLFREGKLAERLAQLVFHLLQTRFQECELILGTPAWQNNGQFNGVPVQVIDTSSKQSYFELLRQSDIAAFAFDKGSYYYRPSAVIAEAISSGCQIVAPNYPVIARQVEWPVTVGATYEKIEDIGDAIQKAIDQLRVNGQDLHWEYRTCRNAKYLANLLKQYLKKSTSPG